MDERTLLDNWNTYQAAWADQSPQERRRMIEASMVPEVVYTDPSSVSHGYGEVTSKMETTQRNFPGASFRNDKFVTHHGEAISHWTMNDQHGTAIFTGVSFAVFAPDGRLRSMTGFFEPAVDA